MMPNFWWLDSIKNNNFHGVSWFLAKNISNLVSLIQKLDNPYCHNLQILLGRKRKSRTQKRASLLFYPFLAKTSYAPMFILHILVMLMYFFRLTLVIWISREIFVSRFWEFTRQWYIKNFWSQKIKIWKNLRKICFSNFFKPTSNLKKQD